MRAFVMVGLPGSGKTTWLLDRALHVAICSADGYFYEVEEGEIVYHFNPEKLAEAYHACLRKFAGCCKAQWELIACDNTNCTLVEVAPYIALAQAFGYEVHIVHTQAPLEVCIARNTHKVPEDTIRHMAETIGEEWGRAPSYWPQMEAVNTRLMACPACGGAYVGADYPFCPKCGGGPEERDQ